MPPTPLPQSEGVKALTAEAIRRIANFIDSLDNDAAETLNPQLDPYVMPDESRDAWMHAALILADQAEIPTATMRAWANRVSRGVQGEFRF